MIIIITGSRKWKSKSVIFDVINDNVRESLVIKPHLIHGGADGADTFAHMWAKDNFCEEKIYKPDYKTFGPSSAPKIRNIMMCCYAEGLHSERCQQIRVLAFPTKSSRGTWHMVNQCKARKWNITIINGEE